MYKANYLNKNNSCNSNYIIQVCEKCELQNTKVKFMKTKPAKSIYCSLGFWKRIIIQSNINNKRKAEK